MLFWHGVPYLIDHGAALTFHHNWAARGSGYDPGAGYNARDHALLASNPDLDGADAALAPLLTRELLTAVVAQVPAGWLVD